MNKRFKVKREQLEREIMNFAEKHPSAPLCGSEYIMQSDEAQEDALTLIGRIFDNCIEEITPDSE